MDKLINDVLPWTPTHGHTSVFGREETYIHKVCADAGSRLEDLTKI